VRVKQVRIGLKTLLYQWFKAVFIVTELDNYENLKKVALKKELLEIF
jgi:hypothetical protein